MKLSPIILKLRLADTRFGTRIVGCSQIEDVFTSTVQVDTAFVLQLSEVSDKNQLDCGLNQRIIERFGIVVALANDTSDKDKTGLTAYDSLYETRSEIFKAILGWLINGTETPIYYVGGRLISFNRAYLWYQFEFETDFRITEEDGVEEETVDWFNSIYTEWELTPSKNVPIEEGLPITTFIPDVSTIIDLTENLYACGFSKGFSFGFDVYRG